MAWHSLELKLDATSLPRAEAVLRLAGAASLSLLDAHAETLLEPEPGQAPLWANIRLQALFAADMDADAIVSMAERAFGSDAMVGMRRLEERDWANEWRRLTGPKRFGQRLLVSPDNLERQPADVVAVRLSPGLAFGTGEHPSTALCLEWLDGHALTGARVIDYGCGSGILAVAALRLGAGRAWALDIEPQALAATKRNAALNGVLGKLWVGTPQRLPDVQADVLIANILARPLEALAGRFAELLVPGGQLVMSGILESQVQSLVRAVTPWFEPATLRAEAGWACLAGSRRGDDARNR